MRYISPQTFVDKRLAGKPKPDWRVAIICFLDPDGSSTLISKLHATPLPQRLLSVDSHVNDRQITHETRINGIGVCVVPGCYWGGPQAAIITEELGYIGVNYIIGFGAAGSISRDLPKCTQIAAVKGLVTDGTSRAYTRAHSLDADAELLKILSTIQGNLSHKVVPATIATVDAIYQETDEAVRQWASIGAQAINMETAPFYAASELCGINSLWLGFVSDCLVGDSWDDWYNLPTTLRDDVANTTVALVETLLSKKV